MRQCGWCRILFLWSRLKHPPQCFIRREWVERERSGTWFLGFGIWFLFHWWGRLSDGPFASSGATLGFFCSTFGFEQGGLHTVAIAVIAYVLEELELREAAGALGDVLEGAIDAAL